MKFLRNLIGVLSPVSFLLTVWRRGEYVGTDQVGNRYYRANPRKGYRHDQRWVVYAGEPQASAVPPEWHGWLHHQTDAVPNPESASYRKPWQKPWRPNLTGTPRACLPPGHKLAGGHRAPATGDYVPWTPKDTSDNARLEQ
ncbi:MAG: NADH:ubiquinone oxidoreductase subunit NDUFA12 [Rhodospirillales bacterium]|nr:NADH:ubiquinone oxidoreductase subunit NDUFA12 [Alphaproteobacteria bacterium]MCB9986653.1 NADH:ubiquinone oxidoreductase subunit NDUFA12 [Rhodospirillales bacterium]USO06819.1 MAG: NADH:ubiquinone oxidoreductase subunit NDUFA12 [Rhodospirillales bacterium]